jgi:hypothetical protein
MAMTTILITAQYVAGTRRCVSPAQNVTAKERLRIARMSDEKKPDYYDMSEAIDDIRHGSYGAKEKTVAGIKLFAKGIFNVGKYIVINGPDAVAKAAEKQKK